MPGNRYGKSMNSGRRDDREQGAASIFGRPAREDEQQWRQHRWEQDVRTAGRGIGGRLGPHDRGHYGAEHGYGGFQGDYGGGSDQGGFGGRGESRGASLNFSTATPERDRGHDPNYRIWRERQLAEFDRDYEEYRRERQQQFDSEFESWRRSRAQRGGTRRESGPAGESVASSGAAHEVTETAAATRGRPKGRSKK